MFEAQDFMNLTVEDANSTEYVNVPPGEYQAVIKEIKPRSVKNKETQEESLCLDVFWGINDPTGAVADLTGRDDNTVRQSIFIDRTASGGLDMGKGRNVKLGRLREALGQNKPGVPWQPANLVGGFAIIRVEHAPYNGTIYANVAEVRSPS